METRVAIVSIIVEQNDSVERLNALLHEYGSFILGRMGVPYHKRGINIISIAMEAPGDVINTLAGKLGRLEGVSVKTVYSSAAYCSE